MLIRNILLFLLLLVTRSISLSQCATANLNVPQSACVGDTIVLSIDSSLVISNQFDLSPGDLLKTPTATNLSNVQALMSYPRTISMVKDSSIWYGFVGDNSASTIYRLTFGNSLNNTPTFDTLDFTTTASNPGGSSCKLQFRKEGSNWYAVQVTGQNRLNIFDFGSSLANNNIVASTYNNPLGLFSGARDTKIIESNDSLRLIVINGNSNHISIVNFGNSLTNGPISGYNETVLADSNLMSGSACIDITRHCNNWIALVGSPSTDNIARVQFGSQFNGNVEADLVFDNGDIANPQTIQIQEEGGKFLGFVKSNSGTGISQIDFDTNLLSTPNINTYGNFGGLTNGNLAYSLDVVSDSSNWHMFVTNAQNNQEKIIRLSYPDSSSGMVWTDSTTIQFVVEQPNPVKIATRRMDTAGNVLISIDSIMVYPAPAVDFEMGSACNNEATAFNNTSTSIDSISDWTWYFGTGDSSLLEEPEYLYQDSGSYQVQLVAQTINGCASAKQDTIEVFLAPTAQFSMDTSCANAFVTINDSSTANSGSIIHWTWIAENDTHLVSSPIIVFDSMGLKNVTLTVSTSHGCADTVSESVFVKPSPTPLFNLDNTCLGDSTLFTNQSEFTQGTMQYSWSFGDGGTSTENHPMHLYSSIGTYEAVLNVIGSNGCIDSSQLEVVVSVPPVVSFTTQQSPICTSTDIQFLDQSTVSTGSIIAWEWNFGGGNIDTIQHPTVSFSDSGQYFVTLRAFSGTKCSKHDSTEIVVLESPEARFAIDATCINQETQLIDSSLSKNGDAISGWTWTVNDTLVSNNANATITATQTGLISVGLLIETALGCYQSTDNVIEIVESPTVQILDLNEVYCTELDLDFTSDYTTDNTDGIKNWSWTFIQQEVILDFDSTNFFSPSSSDTGKHSIQLMVNTDFGCTAIDTQEIIISQSPIVDITFNMPCEFDTVYFKPSIEGTNYSYTWDFGDGFNSELQKPIHIYTSADTFLSSVIVTDQFSGCTSHQVFSLIINPNPIPKYVSDPLCRGIPVTFYDDTELNGDSIIHSNWQFIGFDTSVLYQPTITNLANNNLVLEYSIETKRGCQGQSTSILEYQSPISSGFELTPSYGEAPLQVEFIPENSDSNNTFIVNQIDTVFGDTYTFRENGTHIISLHGIDENGCLFKVEESIFVAPPEVDLEITRLDVQRYDEAVGYIVEIRNNGTRAIDDLQIRASLDQDQSFIETVPLYGGFLPGQTGRYSFTGNFYAENGAFSLACVELIFDLDSLDITPENNSECTVDELKSQVFLPYPNPASSVVYIPLFSDGIEQTCNVEVHAIDGQLISASELNIHTGFQKISIDISDWNRGAYIATISIGKNQYSSPILKQ